MLAYLFAHLTGKLVVDCMPRACGDDAPLDGLAYKSHVTHNVEQLVAGTLVSPHERLVLYVAKLGCVAVFHLYHVGELVELFLRGLFFVDNYGVVEVAALYQVGLKQRFDVADEHECPCRSYLFLEVLDFVERRKLAVYEL